MADLSPQNPLLAAFAVFEGRFYAMFESDQSTERSLKFLGRAEPDSPATVALKDWHESSLKALNENTGGSGDPNHAILPSVQGSGAAQPDDLRESPWYAIFESNPDGQAVGDLWVGRFFLDSEGPRTVAEKGVFVIQANSRVQTLDDAPMMLGIPASRSLIFARRTGTGPQSAEGDHGGLGTGQVRREW